MGQPLRERILKVFNLRPSMNQVYYSVPNTSRAKKPHRIWREQDLIGFGGSHFPTFKRDREPDGQERHDAFQLLRSYLHGALLQPTLVLTPVTAPDALSK